MFRDQSSSVSSYEPIAVIEHQGQMTSQGEGQGHFICDVKQRNTETWYKTNDNQDPISIPIQSVTKNAIVVLYKQLKR